MSRISFSIFCLSAALAAQNPSVFSADPGPLVLDPVRSRSYAAGFAPLGVASTFPALAQAATVAHGPGGHLYFTETVGTGCSAATTTQVYRLPMNGRDPVPPASIAAFTLSTMAAHEMVYDPVTDALYAAGTCGQTSSIYRVSNAGSVTILNPATPIDDPDSIAVGIPGFSSDPHAFIAAMDGLYTLNLNTLALTAVAVDLSATAATSLGNWGFLVWDPNTGTLLGGLVGRPAVRECVEIVFTSPATAVATVIGPDSAKPQCIDHLGIRYFALLDEFGILVPNGAGSNDFRALASGFPASGRLVAEFDGHFLLLDFATGELDRLFRPLVHDAYVVSTGQGRHVHLTLEVPGNRMNEAYLVMASYTGSTPGTTYESRIVPLNRDLITEVGFVMAQTGDLMTDQWLGMIDSQGRAAARFRFPPGIVPSGVTFNLAFILGSPAFTSNSVWIHVIP